MSNVRPKAYEEFKGQVETILRQAKGSLNWTEIREKAKFTQKFPNNKWVRWMEEDIGLVRKKTREGRINWRLS